MLTIITPLKIFRLLRWEVERLLPNTQGNLNRHVDATYSQALEVEAAIKGEQYTKSMVEEFFDAPISADGPTFTFNCSDGKYEAPYSKHTLARHSLLIRGWIEDYPDKDEIDLPNCSTLDVDLVLRGIVNEEEYHLNENMLSVLQLLTPPTDLYYLLFSLPKSINSSFILSIIRGMTQKERDEVLQVHHYNHQFSVHCAYNQEEDYESVRELPDAGRGLAIAYAFQTVKEYLLLTYVPELHDPYPSYRFYEVVNLPHIHKSTTDEMRKLLFSATFDDDCGLLPRTSCESFLAEEILSVACSGTWDDMRVALAMLGVKHELLKNEEVNRLAPYQILLRPGYMKYTMDRLKRNILLLSELTVKDVDAILEPYIVE